MLLHSYESHERDISKTLQRYDYRRIRLKVPNIEFDFDVWFSALVSNLKAKMDKLGSFVRRRPTLSYPYLT